MPKRFLPLLCLTLIALNGFAQPSSILNITRTNDSLRTSWDDPAGVLQQADLLEGPWDLVPALSPYSFAPTNRAKFLRLVRGPGGDIVGSLSVALPTGPAGTQVRIPGISVYLVNLATSMPSGRATTDVNGIFTLPAQPPGHYQFCWEASGYISGCSTQHIAVIGDVIYVDPERPISLASGVTHAMSGQLEFLDSSPFSQQDAFFGIDYQTTVRLEDGKGGLITSALPNSAGQFVLIGVPNIGTGRLVASCEGLSTSIDVNFAQNDAGVVLLPNHRPQIDRVFASAGGQEITRAAPGSTVTLTAVAHDPDGDSLHYLWVPSLSPGSFVSSDATNVQWTLPPDPGIYIMYVRVNDSRCGYATARVRVSTTPERLFSGMVSDSDGVPVSKATVTLGGTVASTDEGGSFTLTVTNDSPNYALTITKGGFAPISRVFTDENAGGTYTFIKPEIFSVPSASQDISLTASKGTSVFIPSNSLTRLDGQAIANPLTVLITTVDPCNPLLESPVSNIALDSTGPNSFLSSLSTAHLQIRDATGSRLSLAAGTAATLSLPFSSACSSNYPTPPADAGVWTYNLSSGTWSQSGTATFRPSPVGGLATYVLSATAANLNNYNAVDPSGPYSTITLTPDRTLAMPFDVRVTGPSFAYTRTIVVPLTLFFAPLTPVTISVLNPKQAPGSYFSDPTNILTAPTPDTSKTIILQVVTNSPAAYTGINVPLKLGLQVPALSTKVEQAEAFLTHNFGVGSAATAASYYAAIDPANQKTTLTAWKTVNGFGAGDEASVVFFNASDLGFGRQMHLRRKIGSDSNTDTAFYVSNFDTVDHARMGFGLIATVAMDYALDPAHVSLGRYTKFYVFDACGNRVDRANLDGGGDKFVPNLCQICHGGNHGVSGTASTGWNLNAKFIPFDMDSYTYSTATGYKPSAQHNAFRTMNLAIRDNTSPTTAITALINGWYGVSGTGTFNRDFVPTAWQGVNDLPIYRDAVKVSCRACHTTRGYDFTTPTQVGSCGYNVCNILVMPDAQRTFSIFWGSKTANVGGTGTPPNQPASLATRYGPSNWSPCP